ncbi:RNA/RNP complex-1-interacting phosphatase-like isoform X1 [Mizuhopecten yessoensis]|uniref:RNA/RNP complex-1-interacting phosphatase-like isoform X1 n=1 Tax=Mizuhopecten yessoensis TaxID=6573 RepID=UPI000B45E1CA|nr:RNA/RNP complex-1-interacting phosphatase-like isoform X1 [Mizuhopecten yessoensis]XP_021352297.1 RNA/RNP complex-1-interacting phosphatase-like isoform X1 [Mizuhopecten yessoensis]
MPPPDRWLDYSNCGKVIPGTNIVCFKVPLKHGLLRLVPAEKWFTPKQLIDHVEKEQKKLKLVIDLTFTKKYYFTDDFTKNGVEYLKIFTEGHVIPSDDVVHRFFDAVETTKAESDDAAVIGVHCTHGVNRTGYVVCRYMIERLAFKPEEAIQVFNAARGHDLERENYLANLHTKTLLEGYKNEERHKLEQKKPQSTYHSHSKRQQQGRSGSQGKDFHNNDDQGSGSHCNDAHRHCDPRSGSRDQDTYHWHDRHSDSHSKSYHTDAYHDNARYEPTYEDRYPYGEYTFEIEEGKRDMQNELGGWDSQDQNYKSQRHEYRGHGQGSRYRGDSYKGQGQDSRGQQYVRSLDSDWRMAHQRGRCQGDDYKGQGQDSRGQQFVRSLDSDWRMAHQGGRCQGDSYKGQGQDSRGQQ